MLTNQKGFGLIEVMITASISLVIMFATVMFQIENQKENKALIEKISSIDIARSITVNLGSANCSNIFAATNVVGGTSALTFNSTAVSALNPYIIKFNSAYGYNAGAVVSSLAPSLQLFPASGSNPGIEMKVTSANNGELDLTFDPSLMVRALKPLSFQNILLQTTGTPTATTIVGCSSSTAASGTWCGIQWDTNGSYYTNQYTMGCMGPAPPNGTAMTCPAGYTFIPTVSPDGNNTQHTCIKN